MLANRLTADPEVSVLVLEAASDRLEDTKIETPGLVTTTLYIEPSHDWSFETVPQVCDKQSTLLVLCHLGLTSIFDLGAHLRQEN